MDHDAVFWDVGGVILDIDSISRAQEAFVREVVESEDLDVTPEEGLAIWRDALREHFSGRDGRRYVTAREGRRKGAIALFDGEPPDDWKDRYLAVREETVELHEGVVETMRRIHEAGVYQAIVSDADDDLIDRLGAFGIDDYVDDVTTSEEVGYVKPDPRMFETAFQKAREAGVDPERGVMVGDKYENDMEGGSTAGLTTAAFGAEDGPAVDHHLTEIRDLLAVVGVEDD